MTIAGQITGVFAGPANTMLRGRPSGIDKQPVAGPVRITPGTGLAGDEQGDTRHHGGPEKAVHHYAAEHYARWRAEAGLGAGTGFPSFGENLRSTGMDEGSVHLEDIYRIGTVVLQVSQSRQPCWRLNERFSRCDMSLTVQATGRTGWYYRVLEAGELVMGDQVELLDRPLPRWPLARLIRLLHWDPVVPADLLPALDLDLPPSWRQTLEAMVDSGARPDQSARLVGPPPTDT